MAFNWFKKKSETEVQEKTRKRVIRPQLLDWSESYVANIELTRALYHNTYPGLKLAGGLAYPPISIPVYFMGLPIPVSDNKTDQELLNELHKKYITDEQQIHIQCHRDGTQWVWPKYDPIKRTVVWEFVADDTVTDIIKDIDTGRIIKMYTDEQIQISTGYNEIKIIRRIREFTESKVKIRYEGSQSISGLRSGEYRNPIGNMPIAFANNPEGGEFRGKSDYSRILPDLKMYHDLELAQNTDIAKFRTKIIQSTDDVDNWLENNQTTITDIDVSLIDLIFNRSDKGETTEFQTPRDVATAYSEAKRQLFKKIVEESGVPEICWGLKTEGNNASVEESMGTLAKYVQDKQRQKQESHVMLWDATLRLSKIAGMQTGSNAVDINWNDMETVNEATKAQIFQSFATGIEKIANSATATKEQLWRLWKKNYPKITEEDFNKYVTGINETASHTRLTKANYLDALESTGDSSNNIL